MPFKPYGRKIRYEIENTVLEILRDRGKTEDWVFSFDIARRLDLRTSEVTGYLKQRTYTRCPKFENIKLLDMHCERINPNNRSAHETQYSFFITTDRSKFHPIKRPVGICNLVSKHYEDLINDPDRLSTEYIMREIGREKVDLPPKDHGKRKKGRD